MELTKIQLNIVNEALQGMRGRIVQEGNKKSQIIEIAKIVEIIESELDKK